MKIQGQGQLLGCHLAGALPALLLVTAVASSISPKTLKPFTRPWLRIGHLAAFTVLYLVRKERSGLHSLLVMIRAPELPIATQTVRNWSQQVIHLRLAVDKLFFHSSHLNSSYLRIPVSISHPHRSEHLHKIQPQVGRHEPDSVPVRQKGKSLHVLMENEFMEILVRISSNPFR